jgi:outer membrane protein assembly factor BamE
MSAMPANHRYSAQTAFLLLACAALASCSSLRGISDSAANPVNWITPYKADLMASLFHNDRWDYVFTLKRQGVEPQSYKYTVFFKGDQLERFAGDEMPSETEFIAKLGNKRKLGDVPVLEATEEQLIKAAGKSKSDSASAPAPTGTPAGAPSAAYPPLESPKQ